MHLSLKIIIHVLFPLLLGGTIYIGFRNSTLLLFTWADHFDLLYLVEKIRNELEAYKQYFPQWFIYSFPNGAWVWSMTSLYTLIWKRLSLPHSYVWITMGLFLALFGEFGQALHLIPGTFDVVDILCIIVSFIIPYLSLKEATDEKL